jgi:hypothetical protein
LIGIESKLATVATKTARETVGVATRFQARRQ